MICSLEIGGGATNGSGLFHAPMDLRRKSLQSASACSASIARGLLSHRVKPDGAAIASSFAACTILGGAWSKFVLPELM